MDNIEFQYFPAKIKSVKPLGFLSLEYFLKAQQNPDPKIKKIFSQIAKAEEEQDFEKKSELKQNNLYYFSPCVILDGKGRGYKNIQSFTGLMVFDYDHIHDAEGFRDNMFYRNEYIVAAYTSPSKRGVKFIVKIPKCSTTEEFKSYFYGMAKYMCRFKGFDDTSKNCVLPLFLSYDLNLKYRSNPKTWAEKGVKINEFKINNYHQKQKIKNVTEEQRKEIRLKIANNIKLADKVQIGHTNVRSASLLAGGYIAAGYITEEEGIDILFNNIDDSEYLSKNTYGYKKTAKTMVEIGKKSPLEL